MSETANLKPDGLSRPSIPPSHAPSKVPPLPPAALTVTVDVEALEVSAKLWKDVYQATMECIPARIEGKRYDDRKRIEHCIAAANAAVDKVFVKPALVTDSPAPKPFPIPAEDRIGGASPLTRRRKRTTS